jgi:arsenate reductase-like glutaredoxin family protein
MMNIILYGTKKCADTRKLERFFQERRIAFQFRDISDKAVTEGELRNLCAGRKAESLVDVSSKAYEKRGLAHMEYDAFDELLANSALLVTPILRVEKKIYVRPTADELAGLLRE